MSELEERRGVKTQFAPFFFLLPPQFDVSPPGGGGHAVAEEGRVRLRLQEADRHHRSIFPGELRSEKGEYPRLLNIKRGCAIRLKK